MKNKYILCFLLFVIMVYLLGCSDNADKCKTTATLDNETELLPNEQNHIVQDLYSQATHETQKHATEEYAKEDTLIPNTTSVTDTDFLETSTVIEDVSNVEEQEKMNTLYTLIVLGKEVVSEYKAEYNKAKDCIMLPLASILKEFGAEIKWNTISAASVTIHNIQYTLNTQECTLINSQNGSNCIIPTPGSTISYLPKDYELMIDDISLETVAMIIGRPIKVDVDIANNTINIQ